MDESSTGGALVHNTNQSLSSNEIQWIIVCKRDGKSKLLPRGMIFVGREECDIILTSTTVDKRHAVIFFNTTNEQFHVKDLNSSYGTYVNEKRIPDQCYMKLEHSDRLRFGFGPDVFIIQKISSLPLISNVSSQPLMITSDNSNKTTNWDNSNEREENLLMKSVVQQNSNNNSESKVPQSEAQTHCSEEQTSTHSPTNTTNHKSTTYPSAHFTSTCVSQSVLSTQLISSSSESENNSNSSLSTVDSLDGIKPSKRSLNKNVLSPVKESTEIKSIKSHDLCSNDVIITKKDDSLKNTKNWVTNSCLTTASNSTTPASAACTSTPGSAMAFIIPFDTDDKSCKKKLNIKDSIRQFAPPKPDSIEKPRPQKATNNDLNKSDNSVGSQKSPTMQSKRNSNIRSLPVTKRSPFNSINETNGHLSDSATYLIHRMLCSETPNPMPVKNMDSNNRRNSSDLSSKSMPTKEKCSPSNSGEKDSGVSDDNKSETGTYTVQSDQDSHDLENARKKIDEVFGVFDESNRFSPHSSPECESPESALNYSQTLLHNSEKSATNNNLFTNQSFTSPKFSRKYMPIEEISALPQQSMANTSTFTRTKRILPTPPNQLIENDFKLDKQNRNKSNVMKDFPVIYSNSLANNITNNSEINSNRNRNALSSTYNTSHNDLSSKSNININNNNNNNKPKPVSISHSAPTTPRSPLVSRKILQLQSEKNPKALDNQRKNSWNYSNSDLDQYESYNSDESTDQSQRSSNSALSKDGGTVSSASAPSKMRFNRAFALRRARLGIETPGIPVEMNKNKTKTNLNTKQSNQQKTNFSRNDGGRFSLRLPKNDINNSRKPLNQNNSVNKMSAQEKTNKPPLQRKISDPMSDKTFNVNRSALKSTQSDNDRSVKSVRMSSPWIQSLRQNNYTNNNSNVHNNNSLQKSASFADSKVMDSNRNSDSNSSVRGIPTFQVGKRFFSTKPHQMAQFDNSMRAKNLAQKPDLMTMSVTETSLQSPDSPSSIRKSSLQLQNKSPRELSALDSLVVSAINQLSQKLRTNMRTLLEKERLKHQMGSETRVLIDEILPQVSSPDRRLNDNNDSNISRDLSNILKNLKKVEQSFDVVSMLLDPNTITSLSSRRPSNGFFVVDV